jgi:Na+/melibiose symporter-like transporter
MLIQPIAGMFSDRNTSKWGRRRPYILVSAILMIFCLFLIGLTPLFIGSSGDGFFLPTFASLPLTRYCFWPWY